MMNDISLLRRLIERYEIQDFQKLYNIVDRRYVEDTISGLKAFLLFSEYDISEWNTIRRKKANIEIKIERKSNDLYFLTLSRTDKQIQGFFVVTEISDGIYVLFSDERMLETIYPTLNVFLNSLYPLIYEIYLKNRDFDSIIEKLKKLYDSLSIIEIRAEDSSGFSHFSKEQANHNYSNRFKEESNLRGKAIKLIKILCKDERNRLMIKTTIKRNGSSILHYGELKYFRPDIIDNVAFFTNHNNEEFTGKERKFDRNLNQIIIKPIFFRYEKNLDEGHIGLIKQILKKPHLSSEISLTSNPYFSATVLDNQDFSTFDLSIVDDVVALIPRAFTSSSSLSKFCDMILTKLGEPEQIDVGV